MQRSAQQRQPSIEISGEYASSFSGKGLELVKSPQETMSSEMKEI